MKTTKIIKIVGFVGLLLIGSVICASGLYAKNIGSDAELAKIGNDPDYPLSEHYELTTDIDLEDWIKEHDWKPIGNGYTEETAFTGTFDGNNFTISNLTVSVSGDWSIAGLFGVIWKDAKVSNLGLIDATIKASGYYSSAGGLVGWSYGNSKGYASIENSYATGTVSVSANGMSSRAGGLVGTNSSSRIENSYVTGTVSVSASGMYSNAGGLVGGWSAIPYEPASIENSYATGTVSASGDYSSAGGLLGGNGFLGRVIASHATGAVSASGDYANAGGLVGETFGDPYDQSSIEKSYATGSVTNGKYTGGLVGYNSGSIRSSYAKGDVKVEEGWYAGGLVGCQAEAHASIKSSFATGTVSADEAIIGAGGLVGGNYDYGSIVNSYATGLVNEGKPFKFVGGLVGTQLDGTIIFSYWDTKTTQQKPREVDFGEGRRTTEMLGDGSPDTYVDWNEEEIVWEFKPSKYPTLLLQNKPSDVSETGYLYL